MDVTNTKEFEEEMKRDRELEILEENYDEQIYLAKVALLSTEPDSITNWSEWIVLNEAIKTFKAFCIDYDIDFKEEIGEML